MCKVPENIIRDLDCSYQTSTLNLVHKITADRNQNDHKIKNNILNRVGEGVGAMMRIEMSPDDRQILNKSL